MVIMYPFRMEINPFFAVWGWGRLVRVAYPFHLFCVKVPFCSTAFCAYEYGCADLEQGIVILYFYECVVDKRPFRSAAASRFPWGVR